MTFLFIILFFFHGLSLAFLALVIGIVISAKGLNNYFSGISIRQDLLNARIFTISLIPSLLLLALFITNNPSDSLSFLPADELWRGITSIRVLIVYVVEYEEKFTKAIAWIIAGLIVSVVIIRLGEFIRRWKSPSFSIWSLPALAVLILYWVLPDSMASGGMVSLRIGLFFFLTLILWICSEKLPGWIETLALLFVIVFAVFLGIYRGIISSGLDRDVREIYSCSNYIQDDKTLLPLNYSGNWMQSHFSNYAGTEKHIVIFENYEAANNYFPLKWKQEVHPYLFGNAFDNPPCTDIEKYEYAAQVNVDYILRWRFNNDIQDSCSIVLCAQLEKNYTMIFKSEMGNAELFLRQQKNSDI